MEVVVGSGFTVYFLSKENVEQTFLNFLFSKGECRQIHSISGESSVPSEDIVDINDNQIIDVTTSRKPTLICGDTQQFKIYPQDTPQIVRKKQGTIV